MGSEAKVAFFNKILFCNFGTFVMINHETKYKNPGIQKYGEKYLYYFLQILEWSTSRLRTR